jgi:hypothetical protein
MKTKIVFWLGLVFVLSLLMAACSGTSPTPQSEDTKSVESVVTEESTAESVATKEPTAESVVTEEPETTGPRSGDIAPDFTLPDSNGNMVRLADELNDNRMVVLVFYASYY